jgi:hypothetical protein
MSTYPVSNRPLDLQIDFFYLQRQVGKYLDYGYNAANWDDEQVQVVQEIIDEGIRQYYFPPPLPSEFALGMREVHNWSFMRPVFQLITEDDQRRYPLPEDWEHPIGDICFTDTANDFYAPIKFVSAARLFKVEFQDNFTSYPQLAAIEPVRSDGAGDQLLQLVLHPTPDTQYDLTCQYQAHAKRVTAESPHPLGGQVHGPGFLASCLSVAELRKMGAEGPMHRKFFEKLAGNIARDFERQGAAVLGYNGDTSSATFGRGSARRGNLLYYQEVLYGNTSYSG